MKMQYLWLLFMAFALSTTACEAASEQKEAVKMKFSGKESATLDSNSQFKQALEEMYRWYIALPANANLNTVYNAEGAAIIENKAAYLKALRESGYFTMQFVERLEKEFAKCEDMYGMEDLDDHLPCLDVDAVTIRSGFDEFSRLEMTAVNENDNTATVNFKLIGVKKLMGDATIAREVDLVAVLKKGDDNWQIEQISGNEE